MSGTTARKPKAAATFKGQDLFPLPCIDADMIDRKVCPACKGEVKASTSPDGWSLWLIAKCTFRHCGKSYYAKINPNAGQRRPLSQWYFAEPALPPYNLLATGAK